MTVKTSELLPCNDCGGTVSHMIKDYEESVIVCDKCGSKWDIQQLWNTRVSNTGETQGENERAFRIGRHILDFAKRLGWKDDGEGAFEYIQRISYAQGLEDAAANTPGAPIESRKPCGQYEHIYGNSKENLTNVSISNLDAQRLDSSSPSTSSAANCSGTNEALSLQGGSCGRAGTGCSKSNIEALEVLDKIFINENAARHIRGYGVISNEQYKIIRAALQSSGGNKGDAWQDISTAPKDGLLFLAWGIVDTKTGNWNHRLCYYTTEDDGCENIQGWDAAALPTHWKLLDAPALSDDEKQEG